MSYNSWPLGKSWAEQFKRLELDELKEKGYSFDDPLDVVDIFEKKVAKFAGSKYAVAVDNCTDALFLSIKCWIDNLIGEKVCLPERTYISVPQVIHSLGGELKFLSYEWTGAYYIDVYPVIDMAMRFKKGMYVRGEMCCLSFQYKKRLPIGKGGMILLDDGGDYLKLKRMRYEGRTLSRTYESDIVTKLGYNMYMTPEDAARGILIFDRLMEMNPKGDWPDLGGSDNYPSLKKIWQVR